MKKCIALLLALVMVLSLAACSSANTDDVDVDVEDKANSAATGDTSANNTGADAELDKSLVYAVEAGSAGEEAAIAAGLTTNAVSTQADALMEVAAGTSGAAVIDLLMAGAMIGEGTSYPNLIHTTELTPEEYGIGCRKGSDLAQYIQAVLAAAYASGQMQEIATTYGVQDALIEIPATEFTASEDSDVAYIQGKGTLVVGITEFAPMDYKDANNEWIGFDADMAKLVAQELGVDIEFVVIEWDYKTMELEAKDIDVVWNGMTLTDEVLNTMECTAPYCKNAQVVVVPAG